jgi:hypothetical protein
MSGRYLKARARTRDPWRVYFLYVSTYDGGKSMSLSWIVSGAPWNIQNKNHDDIISKYSKR